MIMQIMASTKIPVEIIIPTQKGIGASSGSR